MAFVKESPWQVWMAIVCFLPMPVSFAQTESQNRDAKAGTDIYRFISGNDNRNREEQAAAVRFFSNHDSQDDKTRLKARLDLAMQVIGDKEQALETVKKMDADEAIFGRVKWRKFVRVSIYNNPPNAPRLGIYAVVDLVSQFENADRSCGYIVLYKESERDRYKATRFESLTMSNEQAKAIEARDTKAKLDLQWSQAVSQYCPGGAAPLQ